MSDLLVSELIDKELNEMPQGYKENQAYPFKPVRCKESDLENIQPINGFVYFTLDTQKIFYGTGTEFLPMGGNSGIYYANKSFAESADLIFIASDFTKQELPKNIDDLIINVSDSTNGNGFYQVIEIIEDDPIIQETYVLTRQLPVGGGSNGSVIQQGSVNISQITPREDSVLKGNDYWIEFDIEAKDFDGDIIPTGSATWTIHGVNYDGGIVKNGRNRFNVGPYLNPLSSNGKITLRVSFEGASPRTKEWYITAIDFNLEWNYNYGFSSYEKEDDFVLTWKPSGNTPCKTIIWFDDDEDNAIEISIDLPEMGDNVSRTFPSLSYGVHKVSIKLSAIINGEYFVTPTISHLITFIKDGVTPVLTVPFNEKTASQYSVITIPFLVYDPKDSEVEVIFKVNDTEIIRKKYNRDLQTLDYTCRTVGDVKLSLEVDGADPWEYIISVSQLDIDVSEVEDGKVFSLRANDFTINEEIQNWEQNGITLSFENFDWINGGLKSIVSDSGEIEKYICVRQGSRLIINYNLFGKNSTIGQRGYNFKFNFKATNCYDYEAPVLECYHDGLGLKINAQEATFTKDSTVTTTYFCENSYMELEHEIWPDVADVNEWNVGDRYHTFWLDGVPAKMAMYNHSRSDDINQGFQQMNPQPIVIGSDLCDIYIYAVKVYSKKLSDNEHIKNFIADAPTPSEMLKRYHRNDILDTVTGQISYEKLIEKNPECRIYLYELDAEAGMTQDSDDKVPAKYYELRNEYKTLDKPYYQSNDAQIYVQGTSSKDYGRAAFNIRTRFKKGLIDKNGEPVDLWKVTDDAIPIEIACTKVNVASCENANNVVNQEWYNRYQPYHDAHRRKTSEETGLYRDTMEFKTGVMFIKDNNPIINYIDANGKPNVELYLKANIYADEGTKYTNNPYYRFYSIGNMGNDKKNVEVFHDISNPKACCVEISSNNSALQQMIEKAPMSVWEIADKKSLEYEFRYPDGNDKATNEQKQAFIDFEHWMASNNPKAATNEPLEEEVTYGSYTFKGFDPPGYENTESPTGISLKGFTVNTYAGTYTHDTYEYRMAKMLHECEDHLVMDSVVYHYLFIERHTMVDNVAKNTFWSTEDLIHWDLTKDYDNDTSDGINNSGILAFSYGIECLDKDDFGAELFNGAKSVWINFLYGLPEVRQYLYNQLDKKGAWEPEPYLDEFKKHQDILPERVWIADFVKKYLRPRQMGLDGEGAYVMRLDGGKKTHQRNQYETYQDFYLKSRYQTDSFRLASAALNMRLYSNPNGEWDKNTVIPITYYVDCYGGTYIGEQAINSPERIKRGQTFNVPVGQYLDSPSDATCNIYGSKMIQSLKNLSKVYPSYISFGSSGKLRSLDLGSDESGYYNAKLESFSIGANTMLQEVNIQNVGKIPATANMSLNLDYLYALEKLKLTGSSFTILSLADGGVLEELHLNSLDTLRMYNLLNLTHDKVFLNNKEMDEDGKTFDLTVLGPDATAEEIKNQKIRQYRYTASKLATINIENCPGMNYHGYKLLYYAPTEYFTEYSLKDVSWEIDDINELVTENGVVKSLKILDKLYGSIPRSGRHSTSLTGTIKINVECSVDEAYIYNTYYKIYPQLKIEYSDKVDLTPALRVNFYATDLEDSDYLFELLLSTANDKTLSYLTSAEGPAGNAMSNPSKIQDGRYLYYWNMTIDDKDWEVIETDQTLTNEEMLSLIPDKSMTFKPIFTPIERKYKITLLDWNGNDITPTYWPTEGFQYDAEIALPLFHYRPHENETIENDLDINPRRYNFKGWIESKDYNSGKDPSNYTYITNVIMNGDKRYYGYWEEGSVYEASDNKYFNFDETNKSISLKQEYRNGNNAYQGKLTLPVKTPNGNYITTIQNHGFNETEKLEYVYFEEGGQYTVIGENAFNGSVNYLPKLKAIYLPLTIENIKERAFWGQSELLESNLDALAAQEVPKLKSLGAHAYGAMQRNNRPVMMKLRCNKLPDSIVTIGMNAFYYGGPNIKLTKLPDALASLGSWSFTRCSGLQITHFGTSNPNGPLTTILESSFTMENGTRNGFNPPNNEIYLGESIYNIEQNVFKNYGNSALKLIVPYQPEKDKGSPYNGGQGLNTIDIGIETEMKGAQS